MPVAAMAASSAAIWRARAWWLAATRPLHNDAITAGGPGHFGMVFLPGGYRRTKADTGRIIAALEAKLARYPGENDLANGEDWL